MIKMRNIPGNLIWVSIISILFIPNLYSQDSIKLTLDTTYKFEIKSTFIKVEILDYSIVHLSDSTDTVVYNKYKDLVAGEPSSTNYLDFYALACALWNLERVTESEVMFLKILNSESSFYSKTYYHTSDIPGDTSTNIYGYGSCTSNYKNAACRYLSKIYIEKHDFDKALRFIELADKKFIVTYNCGTGHRLYRNEMDGLYCLCYDGLGMYDTIIEKYLPNYSDSYNAILIKAIKKKYSPNEIIDYLEKAEKSIVCIVDTFQTSIPITNDYGTKDEKTIESKYTSGTATINLFGKEVNLATPNLEDGEIITREKFLEEFKNSGFYKALTE